MRIQLTIITFPIGLQHKSRRFNDHTSLSNSKVMFNSLKTQGDKFHRNYMGFLTLEALANSDITNILSNLSQKKQAFFELLHSPLQCLDMFVLILKVISNICKTSLDQIKLKFLLEICNSQFILHLQGYLMNLPYVEDKAKNQLYWNNEIEFWANFITFCDCIIQLSPSTALNKCRVLIDIASKCCLEGLKERHNFQLQDDYSDKLNKLRNTLLLRENENVSKKNIYLHVILLSLPIYLVKKCVMFQINSLKQGTKMKENNEPTDNFRDLNVFPKHEDLICERPFCRPNILKGSYRDTEHYLDVQFRLLREDCFDVIREGIRKWL